MGELKATPGPWYARKVMRQTDDPGTTIVMFDRWGVFTDAWTHGAGDADAHLIAASHDMYEALDWLVRAIEMGRMDCMREGLGKAAAALAKARGENE